MSENFVPNVPDPSAVPRRLVESGVAGDREPFCALRRKLGGPSTGLALLVSYVLLAFGILVRYGTYSAPALTLVLLSFACLVTAFAFASKDHHFDRAAPGVVPFVAGLILCLLIRPVVAPRFYIEQLSFDIACRIWSTVFACLVAACYLPKSRRLARARQAVFALGVLAAFARRIWMPSACPLPHIDVFQCSEESAQHLLEGKNPYTTPVTDVYKGEVHPGALAEVYVYLPANLYLQALSYALTLDVRYACVAAEAVFVAILWWFARRRWDGAVAQLIPLLFLYQPCSFFLLERAYTEPLILLFFVLFLLLRQLGQRGLASAAYGYMLGLKLYLPFFVLQWLLIERNWRYLLLGLAVAFLTIMPFVLVDWNSFLNQGLLWQMRSMFRADSLSVFGYLAPTLGLSPPKIWTLGVGAVVATALLPPLMKMPPLRGYLFAVTITTFAMFLFGSQAFGNYYYFVSGLLLVLLAVGGRAESSCPSGT